MKPSNSAGAINDAYAHVEKSKRQAVGYDIECEFHLLSTSRRLPAGRP